MICTLYIAIYVFVIMINAVMSHFEFELEWIMSPGVSPIENSLKSEIDENIFYSYMIFWIILIFNEKSYMHIYKYK